MLTTDLCTKLSNNLAIVNTPPIIPHISTEKCIKLSFYYVYFTVTGYNSNLKKY